MSDSVRKPGALSRRRFIAAVAAGSAALIAQPAAAAAKAARRAAKPAAKPPEKPAVKPSEFDQQRASTLATLAVIRKHPLPPGGELAAVFQPLRPSRRGR